MNKADIVYYFVLIGLVSVDASDPRDENILVSIFWVNILEKRARGAAFQDQVSVYY
ncbi:hypothetical protein D3C87_2183250 [compost metagenome]